MMPIFFTGRAVISNGCCCLFYKGNVINIQTGQWKGQMSGLGAGLDSFYEYLLKVSYYFNDQMQQA